MIAAMARSTKQERSGCEGQRDGIQFDKASLFFLVVDDIQGVEDSLHARVGAPEGNEETDDEAEAQRPLPLAGDPLHLIADDLDSSSRENTRERIQMLLDRTRIREEAIHGDERGDGGENTQQRVIGHPGRDSQDFILADLLVSPPQNVFPAAGRDLLGTLGVPARTLFSFRDVGVNVLLVGKSRLVVGFAGAALRRSVVAGGEKPQDQEPGSSGTDGAHEGGRGIGG